MSDQPVITPLPNGAAHEFNLNGKKAWLMFGKYSVLIDQDPNYEGCRIEVYNQGEEGGLPVDAAYGDTGTGFVPTNRLNKR